jgi:ketose-bisphosphate aldolase
MRIVPFDGMLQNAREHHFAIGGFNVVNLETAQAVVNAAAKEHTPLIMQVYHEDLEHTGGPFISAIANAAAEAAPIPIALSLDHGKSFEQAIYCIESGFSGVMIDLATSDFQANILTTRKVVEAAHARGVSVEAELGEIFSAGASVEVRNSAMTDPDLAAEFVAKTGVDALAVSIGTAHGIYSSKPVIDFDLLQRILEVVKIPVVVHGGSNTPDEDIVEIVRLGAAKLNIGTDLMMAFNQGMLEILTADPAVAPREALGHARDCVEKVVRHKIQLLTKFRTDR